MTCLQRPSLHVSAHVLYVSKCGKYLTRISNYQQENHGPQCSFRHLRNLAVIPQEYEGDTDHPIGNSQILFLFLKEMFPSCFLSLFALFKSENGGENVKAEGHL